MYSLVYNSTDFSQVLHSCPGWIRVLLLPSPLICVRVLYGKLAHVFWKRTLEWCGIYFLRISLPSPRTTYTTFIYPCGDFNMKQLQVLPGGRCNEWSHFYCTKTRVNRYSWICPTPIYLHCNLYMTWQKSHILHSGMMNDHCEIWIIIYSSAYY